MASQIDNRAPVGSLLKKRGGPKEKHQNSRWREDRDGMSDDHCGMIRKLPCCKCLKVPSGTIHHLKSGTGERGASVRSTDKWGVPLCLECHDEVERAGTRNEVEWFDEFGVDPHAMARALWAASGDLPRMVNVLLSQINGTVERR